MRKTNVQIVTELMEGPSPVGALTQVIVIEALLRYTENVIADKENFLKVMDDAFRAGRSFVHGPSWLLGCEHVNKVLTEAMRFDPTKAEVVLGSIDADEGEVQAIEGSQE